MALARESDRLGEGERAMQLYDSLRNHSEHGAEALFQLGEHYQRQGLTSEAAAVWQEALQRTSDSLLANRIRYRQARILASIGQHQGAIEIWKRFDEKNEAFPELNDVLLQRMADSYMALGQVEKAIKLQERIYKEQEVPRVPRAIAARQIADWHANHARWAEAFEWYDRTLELSEVHTFRAQLIASMAEISLKLNDPEDAHEKWRALVKDYPDTPQAIWAAQKLAGIGEGLSRYEMANLFYANERWQEAIRHYFDYLEKDEDIATAHQRAAQALEIIGNYAGAHEQWREIVVSHPEASALHDTALLNVGRMQLKLGNGAGAMESWESVIEKFPESEAAAEALWERAVYLREYQHNPLAAATELERLATNYPDSELAEKALWEAATLHLDRGVVEKAQDVFALLARKKGDNMVRALFWAGKMAEQSDDITSARRFWATADATEQLNFYTLRSTDLLQQKEWNPRNSAPFTRQENPDMAWLRDAANLPEDSDLYAPPQELLYRRGVALLLVGEREAARESFRDAIDARGSDPRELWAMAYHLPAHQMHSYSILAARRLMNLLGYHPMNAPLPLAELVYPIYYEEQLRATSKEHELDPLLLAALIYQESQWEPSARSSAGARGLTQVIADTGNWIAHRLKDPHYRYHHLDRPLVALRYGAYYLDYVLDKFDDNPFHALASYNSGPGNIPRWQHNDDDFFVRNINIRETRIYVERTYMHWCAYQRIYRNR